MSLLQKPLTYLFRSSTSTLAHASIPNTCLFHSSSLLLGGGARNPEHKRAAQLKRKRLKAVRHTGQNGAVGRSNIRLTPLSQLTKKSGPSPGKPTLMKRKDQPHFSKKSTKVIMKSPSTTSGWRKDKTVTKPHHQNGFTPGVDDFTHDADEDVGMSRPRPKFTRPQTRSSTRPSNPIPASLPRVESSVPSMLITDFSSVHLHEGLLQSLSETLGHSARPTDIQRLSLSHFFEHSSQQSGTSALINGEAGSSMTLLASQTGSGKSIAYLLPVLHSIKWTELNAKDDVPPRAGGLPWAPKALILAPTHELSRQLSRFAKSLSHKIKLRVMSLSQANTSSSMKGFDAYEPTHMVTGGNTSEFEIHRNEVAGRVVSTNVERPVDVLVGTTARVLDLTRGRGWKAEMEELMARNPWEKKRSDDLTARTPHPSWKPSIDLRNIEWVVMDEADVVYGPDFVHSTEMLLQDIAIARRRALYGGLLSRSRSNREDLPFNLILCTATVPNALNHYVSTKYPSMTKLISNRLHDLPRSITPEHVAWTGGRREADVAARLKAVWAEDADEGKKPHQYSKVLVFCNKSTKADRLSTYLNSHGIASVSLIRAVERSKRTKHNDNSISSFLKTGDASRRGQKAGEHPSSADTTEPRVLVTTSLLSRGLDFDDSVRHVFIVDEPRNMVDFIHRAGRTGRAGKQGKVVVFSKSIGRGSARVRTGVRGEIMRKVGLKLQRKKRDPNNVFA